MPSNISSNTNNTVKKGSPQLPILFVIQKSDHVGQENIIGLLTTKEYTELSDSIFKECLFNNVFWVTKEVQQLSFESAHEVLVVQCHNIPEKEKNNNNYYHYSHKILFTSFFFKESHLITGMSKGQSI